MLVAAVDCEPVGQETTCDRTPVPRLRSTCDNSGCSVIFATGKAHAVILPIEVFFADRSDAGADFPTPQVEGWQRRTVIHSPSPDRTAMVQPPFRTYPR